MHQNVDAIAAVDGARVASLSNCNLTNFIGISRISCTSGVATRFWNANVCSSLNSAPPAIPLRYPLRCQPRKCGRLASAWRPEHEL
jgi:hypothetical protein